MAQVDGLPITDFCQVSQLALADRLRLFLPLVALGWLQSAGGGLREAGAARFLLSFYLPLLAADIFLHMIGSQNRPGISGKKRVN